MMDQHTVLDRTARAALGRLTHGLSPAAIIGAYADWFAHLAISPGKQQDLVQKAVRKAARLWLQSVRDGSDSGQPCIVPLEQDSRFSSPEWRRWPYCLIYESFLLTQQWWHNATSGVRGVSRHHEQLVTFLTRQWLDMFSPSNFLLTNPEVLRQTSKEFGQNLMRGAAQLQQDFLRQIGGKPPEGAENFLPGVSVALTPGKVVLRNELIELIQYEGRTADVICAPMLIIPSWIMKYYILDLSPGNSLVRYLTERGHTVFMVSWRNPGASDRDLGMDDYLSKGVLAAFRAVRAICPGQKVDAVGYCLGGTLMAIAAAYLARSAEDGVNSMSLLAAEVDFSEPGELGLFIDESQVAMIEDMMWEQGTLDGKQMAGAFAMLNSRDLVWSRIVRDYLMGERRPMNDLNAWNADATRMPFRQHREYLERLYLQNALAEGRYLVDGVPAVLSDIRVPVFLLGTARDTVSPWRSVYKLHLFTDARITFCLTSGGHNVGIVNPPESTAARSYQVSTRKPGDRYIDPDTWSQRADTNPGSWWPAWEHWLQERSSGRVPARPPGSAEAGYPALDDAPGRYVLEN